MTKPQSFKASLFVFRLLFASIFVLPSTLWASDGAELSQEPPTNACGLIAIGSKPTERLKLQGHRIWTKLLDNILTAAQHPEGALVGLKDRKALMLHYVAQGPVLHSALAQVGPTEIDLLRKRLGLANEFFSDAEVKLFVSNEIEKVVAYADREDLALLTLIPHLKTLNPQEIADLKQLNLATENETTPQNASTLMSKLTLLRKIISFSKESDCCGGTCSGCRSNRWAYQTIARYKENGHYTMSSDKTVTSPFIELLVSYRETMRQNGVIIGPMVESPWAPPPLEE